MDPLALLTVLNKIVSEMSKEAENRTKKNPTHMNIL